MKHLIIFLFSIYTCCNLYGQLDTIRLSEMKSDDVFIIADREDLIKLFGIPSYIEEERQFDCYTRFVHSTDKDTVFYFNSLTYWKNYENVMSYIEKNGKIRLTYFDFKINKNAVIYTPKLKLHRNLKLSDVKRAYNYTDEDIGKSIAFAFSTASAKTSISSKLL
ncbi:MAG: hypothetical protein FWC10_08875 [Lentimicrobiaceae bacterium]|nr:hypothetical protein [Lentimicrobiaceae bacterium]